MPSATRIGSCQGSTITIVPSSMREVAAREVGEQLEHVGHHRVGREVVLDAPERVEAERLDEPADVEVFLVDLPVGDARRALRLAALLRLVALPVAVVLHEQRDADLHVASGFASGGSGFTTIGLELDAARRGHGGDHRRGHARGLEHGRPSSSPSFAQ